MKQKDERALISVKVADKAHKGNVAKTAKEISASKSKYSTLL